MKIQVLHFCVREIVFYQLCVFFFHFRYKVRFSSFYNRLSPIQELETFYDEDVDTHDVPISAYVDTDNVPISYYNTQAKKDYIKLKPFDTWFLGL